MSDVWSVGDSYEPFIGRWSSVVAHDFVEWLDQPPGSRWLDVGCGTGALSETVVQRSAPARLLGVDPSVPFVKYAARRVVDAVASFEVADARSLPADDGAFDVAVSGLVLNFVPDKRQGVMEMARVVADGGLVAAYVWDYAGEMWLLRHFWDAAVELAPQASELHEGRRFASSRPEQLEALFTDAGLGAVESRAIEVTTEFADFDDYWTPFLGGQGPAPTYVQSLDGEQQARLREALRERLLVSGDGAIRLTARAWAVRGTV